MQAIIQNFSAKKIAATISAGSAVWMAHSYHVVKKLQGDDSRCFKMYETAALSGSRFLHDQVEGECPLLFSATLNLAASALVFTVSTGALSLLTCLDCCQKD